MLTKNYHEYPSEVEGLNILLKLTTIYIAQAVVEAEDVVQLEWNFDDVIMLLTQIGFLGFCLYKEIVF